MDFAKSDFSCVRVSPVTKIQLYFDFDACPYLNHLLIFASPTPPLMADERQRQLILAEAYPVNVVGIATTLYSTPFYWKQPYHTLKFAGVEWVQELDSRPSQSHLDGTWGISSHIPSIGSRVMCYLSSQGWKRCVT